jgi:hypothetical protein
MKNVLWLSVFVICIIYAAAAYGQTSALNKAQSITSGRVNTLGKFSFQYGRVDISVKLPRTANGLWPALWFIGSDFGKTPWPDCGEIDLLEMGHASGIKAGTQDKLFSAGAHWGPVQNDGSHPNYAVFTANKYGLQYGDFHLFTLVWSRNRISMYLDLDKVPAELRSYAKPYFEMEITPELEKYFCKPFSIIMNLAAGGTYTGITGRNNINRISALNAENKFLAAMYIDFIRVYDEEGKLIFNDDFIGARLDSALWNLEANDDGGGNEELQSYRRQNVTTEKDKASGKGCLVLSAKLEKP